jgi:hypothetical protein
VASTLDDTPQAPSEREQLVQRLAANMPEAMRGLPQWLLWRFEQHEGEKKPRKVPYYAAGHRRTGGQGSDEDRGHLVSFDRALHVLARASRFDGIGFAFLPGDGLIGIDVDGAIDPESGEISELCSEVIRRAASYTELSPSGRGVHVIVAGQTRSNKDNVIGLEVFCGRQFFTCSGKHWPGSPATVEPVSAEALAWMHAAVDEAKQRKRAPAAEPIVAPMATAGQTGDWVRQALQAVPADCDYNQWIGIGMAIKSALGDGALGVWDEWSQRAAGKYPGTERLQAHWKSFSGNDPDGATTIFKIARRGGAWKPPIEYLAVHGADREREAALRKLQGKPRLVLAHSAPEPADDGQPTPPPPSDEEVDAARGGRAHDKGGGGHGLERLQEHYALIYGTDTVWDGEKRRVMKVANLRLLFGNDTVKMWLRGDARRVVLPEHLVFEPGKKLPPDHVNLFDGFAVEPIKCTKDDVAPMLELLWHLCSASADTTDGVKGVFRWVLRWLALPLQKPGAKLRSALVFHGPQGTGKNLFFDGVASIYGKYGCMVGQTELEDKFNDWLSAKLMIIGNEVVTRQELYHHKNKLKWIITEPRIPIRPMQQSVRWESNHAQVVFLSNEQQPLALEQDDRRYLVVYTPAARDDDLYKRVAAFLDADGAAKFMHYLLNYPLGDFDEHTKPVMTEAKLALIDLSLKPAERFINDWLGGFLSLPVHPCESGQLYRVFTRWCSQCGERYPPNQAAFTNTAKRHVQERLERDEEGQRMAPRLEHRAVTYDLADGKRRSIRVWIPRECAPPEGVKLGDWAAACVDQFERHVNAFGRTAMPEETS